MDGWKLQGKENEEKTNCLHKEFSLIGPYTLSFFSLLLFVRHSVFGRLTNKISILSNRKSAGNSDKLVREEIFPQLVFLLEFFGGTKL